MDDEESDAEKDIFEGVEESDMFDIDNLYEPKRFLERHYVLNNPAPEVTSTFQDLTQTIRLTDSKNLLENSTSDQHKSPISQNDPSPLPVSSISLSSPYLSSNSPNNMTAQPVANITNNSNLSLPNVAIQSPLMQDTRSALPSPKRRRYFIGAGDSSDESKTSLVPTEDPKALEGESTLKNRKLISILKSNAVSAISLQGKKKKNQN